MLIYLILCGFIIWYVQSQKIFSKVATTLDRLIWDTSGSNTPMKDMLECSFCIGFWVCLFVSLSMRISFVEINHPIVKYLLGDYIITAMITSVIYSYVKIGIETKHQNIIVQVNKRSGE